MNRLTHRFQQLLAISTLVGAAIFTSQGNQASAQTITHVPLFTFDGDSAGDEFGSSVSGAGDVNGDGRPDLIVGARRVLNSRGSARVLSGLDGTTLYTFDGDSAFDFFGVSVSGAGDVNGDGLDDFIVGARLGGYARVFVSQIGLVLGDVDLSGTVNFFDIAPLIAVLSSDGFQAEADVNQDGSVNFFDISPFIAILSGSQ